MYFLNFLMFKLNSKPEYKILLKKNPKGLNMFCDFGIPSFKIAFNQKYS